MGLYFGVDVGGTQIKFGYFSKEGILLEKWIADTDLSEAGNRIIPQVAEEIRDFCKRKKIDSTEINGIGMGIPGPVDKNGYVKKSVNLHWYDFNPVEILRQEFPGVTVEAGNDANVAALGEYYAGGGKKYSSMMLITLGTGVGGGIILNGNVLLGANGIAGEIGHITVDPGEPDACNCGNHGCLDQFASANGLVRIANRLTKERKTESPLQNIKNFTAKEICGLAGQGDKLCIKCLEICMGNLGHAMAEFTHAFDPEVFVIGGGVSRSSELILPIIQKAYSEKLHLIEKGADIVTAQLGNDAGITGACLQVLHK